jgi:hypothetical protein
MQILKLHNGRYLEVTFPLKVASSEWTSLLLKAFTGLRFRQPYAIYASSGLLAWPFVLSMLHPPVWRAWSELPANASVLRVCMVGALGANPPTHLSRLSYPPPCRSAPWLGQPTAWQVRTYERMLSAYLDKLVHAQAIDTLVPFGLASNSTFADFVCAAINETRAGGRRGPRWHYSHYAPISEFWHTRRCAGNGTKRYKIEEMDEWYGALVQKLGWESATSTGWSRGCFYLPANGTCETALLPPTESRPTVGAHVQACGARSQASNNPVHRTSACARMAAHYTPEIARLVTAYASNDLAAFGYPRWEGDVRVKWW